LVKDAGEWLSSTAATAYAPGYTPGYQSPEEASLPAANTTMPPSLMEPPLAFELK